MNDEASYRATDEQWRQTAAALVDNIDRRVASLTFPFDAAGIPQAALASYLLRANLLLKEAITAESQGLSVTVYLLFRTGVETIIRARWLLHGPPDAYGRLRREYADRMAEMGDRMAPWSAAMASFGSSSIAAKGMPSLRQMAATVDQATNVDSSQPGTASWYYAWAYAPWSLQVAHSGLGAVETHIEQDGQVIRLTAASRQIVPATQIFVMLAGVVAKLAPELYDALGVDKAGLDHAGLLLLPPNGAT